MRRTARSPRLIAPTLSSPMMLFVVFVERDRRGRCIFRQGGATAAMFVFYLGAITANAAGLAVAVIG